MGKRLVLVGFLELRFCPVLPFYVFQKETNNIIPKSKSKQSDSIHV